MSPNILLALMGFVSLTILGIALFAWTIRSHREEMGDDALPPAPARPRSLSGQIENPRIGPPSAPYQPRDIIGQEALPSIGIPPIAGNATLFGRLLGGILPGLGDLSELSEFVHRREAEAGRPLTADEKKQAAQEMLEELSHRHPDNPLFRQMLESLRHNTGAASSTRRDFQIQVSQIGGKVTLRVDGKPYSSVEEIPDPEAREQARRMLDSMDGG